MYENSYQAIKWQIVDWQLYQRPEHIKNYSVIVGNSWNYSGSVSFGAY